MKLWTLLLPLTLACEVSPPAPATPPSPNARGLSALALQDPGGQGPVDTRIRELIATVQKNPEQFDAWILLGRAWVQKARQTSDPGYYDSADAAAVSALALKPEHPLGLNLRGMVLMNDHRFADAKALMEKAMQKDPDDVLALGVLADALLELGDFAAAAAATQKMVDLKPNLASYARASYLRWLQGDPTAAKEIIRHAMDAGRGARDKEPFAWVTVEAAKLFWYEGDLDGVDAGLQMALQAFPDYPPALALSAKVALARGKAAEAAVLAQKSYSLAALAETAWVWAEAAAAAQNEAEAKEALQKLERLGQQGERRVLAAYLAAKNIRLEEALTLVQTELKTRRDLNTLDTHAWVLYRLGRHAEAKTQIDAALASGVREPGLLFHQGAIQLALGDAKGRETIAQALKLSPYFADAAEARALLAK